MYLTSDMIRVRARAHVSLCRDSCEFHHLKVLEHLIMIMITSDQSCKLEAMGIVGQSLWHRVKLMDQNIEV